MDTFREAFESQMKEELHEVGLTPRLYKGCVPVDVMAFIAKEPVKCEECDGTGWEICTNPDHDCTFDLWMLDSSGCPGCGFDQLNRTKYKCEACGGTGIIHNT